MDTNGVLCVIPARGGSKGIPKKNLQDLAGIPLVAHSIQHAQRAGIPKSNIIVSSDDGDILLEAKNYGATPHIRPDEISGDLSSTEECLFDAVESFKGRKTLLCLQPTSPIRFPTLIQDCLAKYYDGGYDSLHTVTKFYDLFWFERYHVGEYRWYSSYNSHNRLMRQQMDRTSFKYFENGNLYISDIEMLLRTRCRHGDRVCAYPTSEIEGMQIDTMEDLEIFRHSIAIPVANNCILPGTKERTDGIM